MVYKYTIKVAAMGFDAMVLLFSYTNLDSLDVHRFYNQCCYIIDTMCIPLLRKKYYLHMPWFETSYCILIFTSIQIELTGSF